MANRLAGVLPSGLVVIASLLSLVGFVVVRYRSRLATGLVSYIMRYRARAHINRQRVLIVGSGHSAEHTAWILDQPGNVQKFQVSGFVDDDLFAQGIRVYGANVVGTRNDIPKLVPKHAINVIVLADHGITEEQYCSIAEVCRVTNTRFVLMPDMIDSLGNLCRGARTTTETEGGLTDNIDLHCFDCLARHGAERVSSLLQQSD